MGGQASSCMWCLNPKGRSSDSKVTTASISFTFRPLRRKFIREETDFVSGVAIGGAGIGVGFLGF